MLLPKIERLRNANVSNAFHLPSKSVMAGVRIQKHLQNVPGQQITVVGAIQGPIDKDRRMALKRAAI